MSIPLRNREDRRVSVWGVTPSVETDQAQEEHRITTTPSLSPSPPLVLQSQYNAIPTITPTLDFIL